eukprot:TRINITY_DN17467_c0_g1_i2.p2 TRINITY_DN17467_c0_g1~~TRINITY_DN17467_c0_g1_i2.p2  ORF type:complete len:250 (-),score=75.50 TRINITY_DN17467_c0_g1_i2:157-849(-)
MQNVIARLAAAILAFAGAAQALSPREGSFVQRVRLSMATRKAFIPVTGQDQEVAELETTTAGPKPEYKNWEGRCIAHVDKLVQTIDRSYTDVQIVPNLEQQCILEHFFPHVREDGFKEQKACHDFAVKFAEARERELYDEKGAKDGYKAWCADFYAHKYGSGESKKEKKEVKEEKTEKVTLEKETTPAPEPAKKGNSNYWKLGLGLLAILILLALGCFAAAGRRQSRTHM